MSYEKQNFVKGQILKADHLNHMEDGIAAAAVGVQGPKGDKGDVGPQGPKGDKGDTGPAAELDPTLSLSGKAADAAKVGEAVGQIKEDLSDISKEVNGYVQDIQAKYYRINFDEVWRSKTGTVSASAAVSEVSLLDAEGVEQTIASATADSEYSAAYAASNVIDGDLKTMWSSADVEGAVHELTLTLSSPAIIKQLGVVPRTGLSNGVPNIMTVYASMDGADWSEVAHFEDQKDGWAESTWRHFDLSPVQEIVPPLQEQINVCRTDVDGVKYIHTELAGAWDYVGLPATDAPKQVIFAEDAENPMKEFPNYVLSGRNYHPTENKFNLTSPNNGVSFSIDGHLLHFSGRIASGSNIVVSQMVDESTKIPLPDDVKPGDTVVFRTFISGNFGRPTCYFRFYDAENTLLGGLVGYHNIGKDTIKTIAVPDGAASFDVVWKIVNGTDEGDQEMYIAAVIYKSESRLNSAGVADADVTEVSVFPTPAMQLAFDAKVKDYVDMRVDELASMEDEGALGADDLGYLTPEMFGAVGNYSADDTDAIQQCVDAAFGQWPPLKVKMLRKYKTTRPIELYKDNMDVEINWLNYTGDDVAIRVGGRAPALSIVRLGASSGRGIEFNDSSSVGGIHGGYVYVGEIVSGGDCIYCETTANHHIAYMTFVLPRMGSTNGNLINSEKGFVECNFTGGYTSCHNGYALYKPAERSIYRDFSFEGSYRIMYGPTILEHCRTAEALDLYDGTGNIGMLAVFDNPKAFQHPYNYRITDMNVFVYYVSVAVSDACSFDSVLELVSQLYESKIESGEEYTVSEIMYLLCYYNNVEFEQVCAYAPYKKDEYDRQYMPRCRMIVNFDEKIMIPYDPQYKLVDEAEYTPFQKDCYHPSTFETGCDCVIRLNQSYCCIGVNKFRLIQRDGYAATVYDKHGNLLFDGSQHGDGIYEFSCAFRPLTLEDYSACRVPEYMLNAKMNSIQRHYNGKNDVWTITKLAAL